MGVINQSTGLEACFKRTTGMSASILMILNFLTNQTKGTGIMAKKTIPKAMNKAQVG